MSVLRDFERRLEGAVEGIFAKTFRSGVQPVELAKRVLREMDDGRQVGPKGIWVPNSYVFRLSPEDFERLKQAEKALAAELRQVVRQGARERGWALVGPPQVTFEEDETLKKGEFHCDASLVEGTDPEADAMPDAELVLVSNTSKTFPLTKPVTIIGRQDGLDIVLPDQATSRRHAEIRNDGGSFSVKDLGSTNGTTVNGEPITEQSIEDGDHITIGATELEFRKL
ncbi:MAG: DUF3662 and FHA domain-containing protein [Actinomycetota bacterium]